MTTMARRLLLVVVVLSACGKKEARDGGKPHAPSAGQWAEQPGDEVPVPGGQVVVHLETEPPHLNGLIRPDAWLVRIAVHMIHETLIREDPYTGEYVPALAERWEVSPDKLTYTFHLRAGVRWHDGAPFGSRDVAFTIEKLFDPSVHADTAGATFKMFGCDRWETPDKVTFRLFCKKPYFLFLTSLDDLPIFPAHAMGDGDFNNHAFNAEPVGTGPYKFDHWLRGREIVVVRNDAYWGRKGHLDRIVYKFVESPATAVQLAAKAEIDFVSRVREAQWFDDVQKNPRIKANFNQISDWPSAFNVFVLNVQRPALSDVRVRRALAHLVDADTILDHVMHGMGKRTATVYYEKAPGCDDDLLPYPFDPERAKQLLDEAGWKDSDGDGVRDKAGTPLRFTLLLPVESPTMEPWGTRLQEELRKAGVRMDVSKIQFSVMYGRGQQHEFDAMAMNYAYTSKRMDPFDLFHSSQTKGGLNWAAFHDKEMDDTLDVMRSELDEAKRVPLDRRIQEIAYEQMPYIMLFRPRVNAIVHKRVRGVKTSVEWYQLQDWWIPKRFQTPAR
jgi:peptide/nickel transport system substrate-binding protein